MDKQLYAVYDVKTGVYGQIMMLLTDGEALRICTDEVNRDQGLLANHSEDYRLDLVGTFNQATGEITTINVPRHIIDLAQLKKVK